MDVNDIQKPQMKRWFYCTYIIFNDFWSHIRFLFIKRSSKTCQPWYGKEHGGLRVVLDFSLFSHSILVYGCLSLRLSQSVSLSHSSPIFFLPVTLSLPLNLSVSLFSLCFHRSTFLYLVQLSLFSLSLSLLLFTFLKAGEGCHPSLCGCVLCLSGMWRVGLTSAFIMWQVQSNHALDCWWKY